MFHSNYQLSFGVELEFMFVFHEKLLIGQLRIDSGKRPFTKKDGAPLDTPTLLRHQASIQKDLPDEVREELRQGAQHYRFHHPHYPSWGLSTPRSQSAKDKRPFEKNRIEGMRMTRADDGTMIRTYDLEPIRMAREVLLSNGAYDMWRGSEHLSSITGLRIGTRSGAGQHKPVLEFKHWHVTSDYSLSGFDQDELAAYLEKYKVCNSRDGSGASPFSNGLATNSITHLYRPASDSSSSQSQDDLVSDADILSALDDYLTTVEPNLTAYQPEPSNAPTWSVNAQVGRVLGKRKPGPITNQPLSKRTRLSASPQLGQKQTGLPDVNDWDTYGVELVSSVLRPLPEDFETITRFCNLLKGEPCHDHGATINDTCGFHIHLKPDGDNNDFDLNTVQHLAYIIAIYEREIDTLHPFHRRTYAPYGATNYDFRSNTQKLQDYDGFLFEQFIKIQQLIGGTQNVLELQRLMGKGKGYVVNFSNLLRHDPATDGPRTIEFRQHEGVLRGEMVEWWVRFCIGLVQLAHHAATQLDAAGNPIVDFHQQCQIYPFQESNDQLSVWDLFDLVDFPEEGRRYFQRRAAYFADNPQNRDPTASVHSSYHGYKGPQRYRTPDPPSHSNLTSLSPSSSGNSKATSLVRQTITRVAQYRQNMQPRQVPDLAAIVARHSAAGLQAAAEKAAADSARAVATANMATGTAGLGTAATAATGTAATGTAAPLTQSLTTHNYPVPRANSPSPLNPLPSTTTTTTHRSPPHYPHTFLHPNDTPPQIQGFIPINSPEGLKVLKEKNLPGLTYVQSTPSRTRSRPRTSRNRSKIITLKVPSLTNSSSPATPSPLKQVTNASHGAITPPKPSIPTLPSPSYPVNPAFPSAPNPFTSAPFSPFPPSVLPSSSPPGGMQQPPLATPTPAARRPRRRANLIMTLPPSVPPTSSTAPTTGVPAVASPPGTSPTTTATGTGGSAGASGAPGL
ncbi:mucin 5B, oligomeric mucus gel-forming [Xylographa vitiligo]|nr:mucin 5B, oligomeric mucus gel-forming [Xylographa vitiligo]